MAKLKQSKIDQLHFDNRNINKGSAFGQALLEKSITETGMGRSLLADKNGVLIGGNKTLEAAVSVGLEKVVIVETDGNEIVVVKRNDLDINSPQGIKAKILDNTVSAHNYVEDVEMAEALCEDAAIENVKAYGLNETDDDERVSFKASKKAIIKIELQDRSLLAAAEKDINYLMNQKYPGTIVTAKGK